MEKFFAGLHQPNHAEHFTHCMISINRLWRRRDPIGGTGEIMLDSGAFTEISTHKRYRRSVKTYADAIARLAALLGPRMVSATAQDYMCEPFILALTGLTVPIHQAMTIKRYDRLRALLPLSIYVLPVLQGYSPEEYVSHVRQYGARLAYEQWVGVGSVCKRQGDPAAIEAVLMAIEEERPDLRLHGFGVKTTGLESTVVRDCLYSADSLAWSSAARWARAAGDLTRSANDWREARDFVAKVLGRMGSRQRHFQQGMWGQM